MPKLLLAASMLCMGTAAHAEPSFYRGAGLLLCARFNQQLNATKLKATAYRKLILCVGTRLHERPQRDS